jgi:hypothetical protein
MTHDALDYNVEAAERYGRLVLCGIDLAIGCDSDTETLHAYLNARWAFRMAAAVLDDTADTRTTPCVLNRAGWGGLI